MCFAFQYYVFLEERQKVHCLNTLFSKVYLCFIITAIISVLVNVDVVLYKSTSLFYKKCSPLRCSDTILLSKA